MWRRRMATVGLAVLGVAFAALPALLAQGAAIATTVAQGEAGPRRAAPSGISACDQIGRLAGRAAAEVPADAEGRLLLTRDYYHVDGLGYGFGPGYGLGTGQVDFTRWEVARGVLDANTGSPWWRTANGALLRDMLEARHRHEGGLADCDGAGDAVRAWLAYLTNPAAASWYAAHNASIVAAYRAHEDLARQESFAERVVMANTLYRVTLADRMVVAPDDLVRRASDPRGPAVALITALDRFYPAHYPLTAEEAKIAGILYLVEGNPLPYAGVDAESVSAFLRSLGVSDEELAAMRDTDTSLYRQIFPWFTLPPAGPLSR